MNVRLSPLRSLCTTLAGAMDELLPSAVEVDADLRPIQPWQPDAPEAYCPRCGASAGPGAVDARGCPFCREERLPWHRLTRLGPYTSPLDDHIREMKFAPQWRWAAWLGDRLAEALPPPIDPHRVLVCPVPMHWRRRWRRGFNQAALMAEHLARQRGWPCGELLYRTRHTQPQTAVVASKRHANVRDSFAARPVDLAGQEIILVDDVKTSGATLTTCSRLLRGLGARSVHVAVAAVADGAGRDFTRIAPRN